MNVYLIGYRGCGKSTVAPLLAARLGPPWQSVDMDQRIAQESDVSIAQIFEHEGEGGFRERESRTLAAIAKENHLIVATGGGAVLRKANREVMSGGAVVWLQAAPETLWNRLQSDPTTSSSRPNLTSVGGLQEIRQVLTEREPLYRDVADLALSAQDGSPDDLVAAIANWITGWAKRGVR